MFIFPFFSLFFLWIEDSSKSFIQTCNMRINASLYLSLNRPARLIWSTDIIVWERNSVCTTNEFIFCLFLMHGFFSCIPLPHWILHYRIASRLNPYEWGIRKMTIAPAAVHPSYFIYRSHSYLVFQSYANIYIKILFRLALDVRAGRYGMWYVSLLFLSFSVVLFLYPLLFLPNFSE